MGISMIRKPSETPNITNIDDIIPFRYAYGNQDGYVKNKGSELSYDTSGNQFRINSGRIVLQGVESDIDSDGYSISLFTTSETRYYTIYYSVNLATNEVSIENTYSISDYPRIETGDDLNSNPTGIANLVLYHLQISNGYISNVEKIVKPIEYLNDNEGTVKNAKNIVAGGTIASDVTGTTQPLTTNNTTLATTEFVQQLLEDKMNKFELIASPNTNTYDLSTAIQQGYKFIKVVLGLDNTEQDEYTTTVVHYDYVTTAIPITTLSIMINYSSSLASKMTISNNILKSGTNVGGNYPKEYKVREVWGQK